MASFATFDFSKDEGWQRYKRNVFIPPGKDEAAVLQKLQQKYYKQNIDPSYEIKDVPLSSSAGSSDSRPSSSAGPQSSPQSNQTHAPRQQSGSAVGAFSTMFGQSFTNTLFVIINLSIVVHSILFLLPFFGPSQSVRFYRKALFGAMALYALVLLQKFGLPKLSSLRKIFDPMVSRRFFTDSNAQYLLMSGFFISARPSFLPLVPVATAALFQVAIYVRDNFRNTKLYRSYGFAVEFVISHMNQLLHAIAVCEATTAVMLMMELITPRRQLLLVFMYMQFLVLRYQTSSFSRAAVDRIAGQMDFLGCHPMCPAIIKGVYMRARKFASTVFNPPPQAARAR
mmetsp:Transcript_4489/g.6944  ORF Transcript_4489/g.6944 Transcript_4489/m.6944 type:complete len:340 (-) Transcript_4489:195-1214(-)|eukprot:CAMPEP_0184662982 /NCGR_PEP_ID=MMETSP0308-20130426/45928_1 /TAXON_ID=38269 /ORGANISM="Gloeochaete witrockiana, Strain SAG 46.84" /LENGTH=339 /DNA_ID=CAMNT_0027105393 /DNA_START=126 /DNA_END=1145 /DNA_ORIENTATION=+